MVDPRLPIESQSGPPACHAGDRSDPNPFGCEKVTDWITSAMHDLNLAAGAADASRAMLRTLCLNVAHPIAVLAHAHFLSTAKPRAYR